MPPCGYQAAPTLRPSAYGLLTRGLGGLPGVAAGQESAPLVALDVQPGNALSVRRAGYNAR
jgi:hypothetical protein